MDTFVLAVLCVIVGLGLGFAGMLAFRYSERGRQTSDLHSEQELPDGLAEVLAVLPSAAIVIDAGDDVVKASPAAYTFGLVRGHALTSAELLGTVSHVRTRGLIQELSLEQPRSPRSSSIRYLHARVAPLGPDYILVLCDDHTETKRVDAVRRDFVANVSHELKTPIGAIALLAEAVHGASDDSEAVERFGLRMQRESARLAQLVQEIIDLSRVQDHDTQSHELVAVSSLINEAVDRAAIAANAKKINIVVAAGDDMYVEGNEELLINAVRNLVDNAVNYSNEDTEVGVGVRSDDERVLIAVKDQGIGLSKEDTERVFERFYRVDPARSRMTGGTGLGLSIVKHIAATHGGEVTVWSQLGEGSTFTLVLPLADPNDYHHEKSEVLRRARAEGRLLSAVPDEDEPSSTDENDSATLGQGPAALAPIHNAEPSSAAGVPQPHKGR